MFINPRNPVITDVPELSPRYMLMKSTFSKFKVGIGGKFGNLS
jgi:hypothetical protein